MSQVFISFKLFHNFFIRQNICFIIPYIWNNFLAEICTAPRVDDSVSGIDSQVVKIFMTKLASVKIEVC